MAKKKKASNFKEKTMALEEVENLTLEQVVAKSSELASENKGKESTLDKYIREHRAEIESAKKQRLEKTIAAANALDQFVKTAREDVVVTTDNELTPSTLEKTDSSQPFATPTGNVREISSVAIESDPRDGDVKTTETVISDTTEATSPSETTDAPTALVSDDDRDLVTQEAIVERSDILEPSEIKASDQASEVEDVVFPEVHGTFDQVTLEADDIAEVDDIAILGDTNKLEISQSTTEKASQTDALAKPLVSEEKTEISTVPPLQLASQENSEQKNQVQDQVAKDQSQGVLTAAESEKTIKNYKRPVIIGICAVILLAAGGVVWSNIHQANKKEAAVTRQSTQKKSQEAKQISDFNKKYDLFFLDEGHTKLKNDQFSKISGLVSELDKLKTNSDYKALKTKVANLKTDISVITEMNANFNKAIITDGVLDKTAVVKDGVKLSYTATENATLNALLKEAVTHGQSQQTEKEKAKKAAATPSQPSSAASPQTNQAAPSASSQAAGTTSQANAAANQTAGATTTGGSPTGYGLTTAQYQGQYPTIPLETSRSRVPVDPNANLNDAAFVWAADIKERVLQKCRERGYISGDGYILLPASIQKGNGYYNLYKSDGTYLVSINCKTGYFVGNAAGHADDLDY